MSEYIEIVVRVKKSDINELLSARKEEPKLPASKPASTLFENRAYVCIVLSNKKQILIAADIDADDTKLIERVEKKARNFYGSLPIKALDYATLVLMVQDGWTVDVAKTPTI